MNRQQTLKSLRQHIRQQRRSLSSDEQQQASKNILLRLKANADFCDASTVSAFLSFDGEINLMPVIEYCWQQNKRTVLPVIHPFNRNNLLFLEYDKQSELIVNSFGIREPKLSVTNMVPLADIDVMLTPLVAFDAKMNRVGMGGGYYDRTLASKARNQWPAPIAIGIAHDCQKVQHITPAPWDQPLQSIITPSANYTVANPRT